ncbi:MAG: RnfH family protein [Betaproteobacteria bacterium]|nr:RnfH family protein [Betaproteobacteria bacterium]
MRPPARPEDERRAAPGEDSPAGAITVTVVWATPAVQEVVAVTLPIRATVADALARSGLVAAYRLDPAWLGFAVGGRRARLVTLLADGDRLDLTRPLAGDPKTLRRLRAQAQPLAAVAKPPRARARARRRRAAADLP